MARHALRHAVHCIGGRDKLGAGTAHPRKQMDSFFIDLRHVRQINDEFLVLQNGTRRNPGLFEFFPPRTNEGSAQDKPERLSPVVKQDIKHSLNMDADGPSK